MRIPHQALVLAVLLVSLRAGAQGAIHPYTQQIWDEWQELLKGADDAMARKAPVDEMMKALEATDALHAEKNQVLKRHPDYETGLDHQLAIRLSLVKLYTNVGFLYAKTAAEKRDASLLTQPAGAFSRLEQAAATLESYGAVRGKTDPGYVKMEQYVSEIRKQVDSAQAQLDAAGVSVAPASATAVDKGTQGYFRQWWEKLARADKAFAAGQQDEARRAVESAQAHQKGWNGWLVKHSEYAKTLARQDELTARLAAGSVEGQLEEALKLGRKGFDEKNPNYFGERSGPNDRVRRARAALEAFTKAKGAGDPEVQRLSKAVEAADRQIAEWGTKLATEARAKRQLPADAYRGADKRTLEARMLAYWKQKYPADKVLGVRLFEEQWTRETNWKANETSIYKSDYSWLPAKMVVQTSADVATLYPVFANKQHQQGDEIIVSDDRAGAAYVVSDMLLANAKF